MDAENLYHLAEESGNNEAVTMFREKGPDGSYSWMVYDAVVLTDTKNKDILLAVRDDVVSRMVGRDEVLAEYADSLSAK